MKLKKFFIIFIFLSVSILFINPLKFILDTDDVDKTYINETYGKGVTGILFYINQMWSIQFDDFRKCVMENAAFNQNLTDAQRKDLMSKVKNMKFIPKKIICFAIQEPNPLLPNDLKFNVKLLNAKGESLSIFDYDYTIIVTGNIDYYVYYWLIEADKPLVKNNYNADELPIKLIVEFPNGQKRVYIAKM